MKRYLSIICAVLLPSIVAMFFLCKHSLEEKVQTDAGSQLNAQKESVNSAAQNTSGAFFEADAKEADLDQAKKLFSEIEHQNLSWNDKSKQDTLAKLFELVNLHATASASKSYSGLVLVAQCEGRLAKAIVEGCAKEEFEIAEARDLVGKLRNNRMSNETIARLIAEKLPHSVTAQKASENLRSGKIRSLTEVSDILIRDQGLDPLGMSRNIWELINSPNISRAVQYYAITTRYLDGAAGILQYLAEGGKINQDEKELVADITRRLPDFFNELSSTTGNDERPEDLAYLLKRWTR